MISRDSPARPPSPAGFTLLEMIVVLAILGAALSLFAFTRPVGTTRLSNKAVLSALLSSLREARVTAIEKQLPARIVFDIDTKNYYLSYGHHRSAIIALPDRLALSVATGTTETVIDEETGRRAAAIKFLPDGSSTGGRVEIRDGTWDAKVMVNWLTGGISVDHSG